MLKVKRKVNGGKIVIPADANPWPHERRVAKILVQAGYNVEFIPKTNIGTPDIYLGNVRYEIKSPITNKTNTLERRLKEAVTKQSCNIIIDSSRTRNLPDYRLQAWLISKCRMQPQIKRLLFINKRGEIIDIKALV